MRQLKSAVEPVGSIVASNALLENGRVTECAEVLPGYTSRLAAVKSRVVDLDRNPLADELFAARLPPTGRTEQGHRRCHYKQQTGPQPGRIVLTHPKPPLE